MRKQLLIISLLVVFLVNWGNSNNESQGTLVTETYIVKTGDTLWGVSEQFIQRNTYGTREIREFYHGVIETNYDTVFKDRQLGELHPGDRLQINYWIKKDLEEGDKNVL